MREHIDLELRKRTSIHLMPATLNKEQMRVYEWLANDLRLPVYAEAYKGAVILTCEKSAGYVSFVAHAGRDLINGLAATVKGIKREQVQYRQLVDEIQKVWRDEWRISDTAASGTVNTGNLIPAEVCEKISKLINEHESSSRRNSSADGLFFSTFLDYSDKGKIPSNFLKEWKAAKAWFQAHAHLSGEPLTDGTRSELVKHFHCLDGYLYIAASSQYERLKELNEILDATNR